MPHRGSDAKRREINLVNTESILPIENKDELCLARALLAKSKIDNDSQYESIADHRRPKQTRLAQELFEKAAFPLNHVIWTKSNSFRHI